MPCVLTTQDTWSANFANSPGERFAGLAEPRLLRRTVCQWRGQASRSISTTWRAVQLGVAWSPLATGVSVSMIEPPERNNAAHRDAKGAVGFSGIPRRHGGST